jgi:hypothetical protein
MITITNKINQEDKNNSQQIDTMHKKLDKFIQNCLNKFKFVEVKSDIYSKVGKDKNSIISHKSTIPDLVIWNKPFNKNECFDMKDLNKYNKYPRTPFYLRLTNKEEKNKNRNALSPNNTKDEFSPIESLVNLVDKLHIKEENTSIKKTIEKSNNENPKQSKEKNNYENINYINEKGKEAEFQYGKNITNYITPINKSKKTMNDYYQNQFKQNELLMNYVYSFLDKKGWIIFRNDGVYLSNYTSFELFTFLTNGLKNNTDLKMYVIGMQQDNSFIFNGEQIYIILSQALPIILQKKQTEYQLMRKKKMKENNDNKLIKLNKEEKENINNNCSSNTNSNNLGNGRDKFAIKKNYCENENNEKMMNNIRFNVNV